MKKQAAVKSKPPARKIMTSAKQKPTPKEAKKPGKLPVPLRFLAD